MASETAAVTFSPERSALRGVGASAVFAAHLAAVISVALAFAPVPAEIAAFLHPLGWAGVALFLALSCYLLMGSLDSGISRQEYFVRRIRRIWPLYFAAVLLTFVLEDRNVVHLVANATFVAAIFPQWAFTTGLSWAPNGVLWTVQVEEFAYLGLPLVALFGRRERLLVAWALAMTSINAVAIAPDIGMLPGTLYLTPWPWLGCYSAGLVAYELRDRIPAWPYVWGIVAGLPFVFPTAFPWPLGLALTLPLTVTVVVHPPAFLRRSWLVVLGESSYALYLFQVLWLCEFGWAGSSWAYVSAVLAEIATRPRQFLQRLRFARLSGTNA